jgi:hypothetical protein
MYGMIGTDPCMVILSSNLANCFELAFKNEYANYISPPKSPPTLYPSRGMPSTEYHASSNMACSHPTSVSGVMDVMPP